MKPISQFCYYILGFYENEKITLSEAIKYTKMYKNCFPNLWSNGDSVDRENVYQLFLMGRSDAIARENKQKEELR